MSQTDDRREAQRWLDTAKNDLGAARELARSGYHAQACFLAQQCAEKAAKAMWYSIGGDPWGHAVQSLVEEFPLGGSLADLDGLRRKAALLDRFYIPTRYPNGLPGLTPEKAYFAADSETAIHLADELWQVFKDWIEVN